MQLNEARFEMYNRCGFVPQHSAMHDITYDPFNKATLKGIEPLILNIQVSANCSVISVLYCALFCRVM